MSNPHVEAFWLDRYHTQNGLSGLVPRAGLVGDRITHRVKNHETGIARRYERPVERMEARQGRVLVDRLGCPRDPPKELAARGHGSPERRVSVVAGALRLSVAALPVPLPLPILGRLVVRAA